MPELSDRATCRKLAPSDVSRVPSGASWKPHRHEEPVGQVARFNIYPEPGSKRYCEVRIFKSLTSMYDYARDTGADQALDFAAIARGVWRRRVFDDGRTRMRPVFAEVLLTTEVMTTEFVVHEAAHVALRFAERIGFDPRSHEPSGAFESGEERYCYAIGRIANGIVLQLAARGLIG